MSILRRTASNDNRVSTSAFKSELLKTSSEYEIIAAKGKQQAVISEQRATRHNTVESIAEKKKITGAVGNNHWKKGLLMSKKDQQQNYQSFKFSQLTLAQNKNHEKGAKNYSSLKKRKKLAQS